MFRVEIIVSAFKYSELQILTVLFWNLQSKWPVKLEFAAFSLAVFK